MSVKVGWERKLAGIDVVRQDAVYQIPVVRRKGFEFGKGTRHLAIREAKEGKQVGLKHSYWFVADPATGLIMIMGFRGDEE